MTKQKIPKVRIAKPGNRPYQLRYTVDPKKKQEVRISTGTHDEAEALCLKAELEAKLLLGLPTQTETTEAVRGPGMSWEDFREEYTRLAVNLMRSENTKDTVETRLDLFERIAQPRTLAGMAERETLATLQAELLAGTESRKGPRSAQTVESYMMTLKAALNWAHKEMGWLPEPFKFRLLEVDQSETLKGRPLTDAEFKAMLESCETECKRDPASWKFLLRGIWESGLRLDEAMNASWDDRAYIVPLKTINGGYLLRIPATRQKNHKTQEVPTTPFLGSLLDEVPDEDRTGWIFNPEPRRKWNRRLSTKHVGRIITDIGEEAGIVVNEDNKFASAHDLRRSFGQRMADAGMAPRDLQAIMRHSSLATTEKYYLRHRAVEQADRIAKQLQGLREDCTHFPMGTPAQTEEQVETTGESCKSLPDK